MPTTERLLLRRPVPDDAASHFALHGDPATNLYNPSGPITDRRESGAILDEWCEHWDRAGFGYWAVSLRSDPDAVVGFGGIMRKTVAGAARLNLYFRLAPHVWGRGLATELGRSALDQASRVEESRETYALVRPDNLQSIAVIRKLGLVLVGEVDDVPGSGPSLLFATRIA